jgi:glycosyltransferase involved in cell wall biosynthesis
VSSTQRDNYPKYPYRLRENIVLYNGIDLIRFHPKVNTKVNDIVKEDHSIILGSVGNFTPVRDQMFLCRFLKLLDLRNVPFRFYFIGSRSPTNPELFESCRNFCFENGLEDKVFFLGDREDVPDVLGNLDAFLYATKYDTFGIAVVEALAMGIPVFLNDWTTFVEITDSGKHAIIYRTDDVQDLMDRFKEFSQKREHFKHQFQLQSKYIRDKFSIEEHVKQLREVYNDFLN